MVEQLLSSGIVLRIVMSNWDRFAYPQASLCSSCCLPHARALQPADSPHNSKSIMGNRLFDWSTHHGSCQAFGFSTFLQVLFEGQHLMYDCR